MFKTGTDSTGTATYEASTQPEGSQPAVPHASTSTTLKLELLSSQLPEHTHVVKFFEKFHANTSWKKLLSRGWAFLRFAWGFLKKHPSCFEPCLNILSDNTGGTSGT